MCRTNSKEFKLQQYIQYIYCLTYIKVKMEIFVTSLLRNYSPKRHVVFKTKEDIMERILGKIGALK